MIHFNHSEGIKNYKCYSKMEVESSTRVWDDIGIRDNSKEKVTKKTKCKGLGNDMSTGNEFELEVENNNDKDKSYLNFFLTIKFFLGNDVSGFDVKEY